MRNRLMKWLLPGLAAVMMTMTACGNDAPDEGVSFEVEKIPDAGTATVADTETSDLQDNTADHANSSETGTADGEVTGNETAADGGAGADESGNQTAEAGNQAGSETIGSDQTDGKEGSTASDGDASSQTAEVDKDGNGQAAGNKTDQDSDASKDNSGDGTDAGSKDGAKAPDGKAQQTDVTDATDGTSGTESGAATAGTSGARTGAGSSNVSDKTSSGITSATDEELHAGSAAVSGQYLTVTVPWADNMYSITKGSGYGVDSVSFYDASSAAAGAGGHLFTIACYQDKADYADLPSRQFVGTLSGDGIGDGSGKLYVVAVFPTDVQASQETSDQYQIMEEDAQTVISSLVANSGYTFTKGK
jgi:hypothetical protein